MKIFALAGGVTMGLAVVRNSPDIPHASKVAAVIGLLLLMGAAYLAGKRAGAGATAVAVAEATAKSKSRSQATGGRADSRVQVVVLNPGADPAQAAALVGGTAYTVDAPDAVREAVSAQRVHQLDVAGKPRLPDAEPAGTHVERTLPV